MPKISIIVPVYNVENYIDKCLSSLINQTIQDIEIIIVNDGSSDKSEEIIEKYTKTNNKIIKYYEKENGGLSSARNLGIEHAIGEYITFLDSDDYVEKETYEEMYKLAKIENADIVECDYIWEWAYGKKVYDKRKKYKNKKEMMKRPRVVAWNKIYRREIISKTKTKFPEGLIYEDMEFFYKLLPFINKISYINKYFVHYTQRNDSISKKQTEKTEDIFKVLCNIFEYYKENNLYSEYEKELKYLTIRILLGSSLKRIFKIKNSYLKRKMLLKTVIYLTKYLFEKNKKIENKDNIAEEKRKTKICFGITKLDIGGAERALVDTANELIKDYDISIFTIYGKGKLEKELDSKIKIMSLFKSEKKNIIIPIYILICGKQIYNKYLKGLYDIDIAFLEGPMTRLLSYKGNKRKIAWVHNDISKIFGNNYKSKIKRTIDSWLYKKYEKIIFVSEQNKEAFEKIYGKSIKNKVIYNYININRVQMLAKDKVNLLKSNGKVFVTVSRLVKQKAIDRLIKVHKRLIDDGFQHKVYVIGDGKEKKNLIKMQREYDVENSFTFLGEKENPYPYINKADYFLLFSDFEGYGIVIEEAKILNKPILVTSTAAKEAVINYDKKIVVTNNENAIFDEMKKVLQGDYKFLNVSDKRYEYDNKYLINQIKDIL